VTPGTVGAYTCCPQSRHQTALLAQAGPLAQAGLLAQTRPLAQAGLLAQTRPLAQAGLLAQTRPLAQTGRLAGQALLAPAGRALLPPPGPCATPATRAVRYSRHQAGRTDLGTSLSISDNGALRSSAPAMAVAAGHNDSLPGGRMVVMITVSCPGPGVG